MERRNAGARWAPLTGVLFFVLVLVALAAGGSTPDDNDSAQKVLSYYVKHRGDQETVAFLLTFAGVFLFFFSVALARRIRLRELRPGGLSTAVIGAGAVGCLGWVTFAAAQFALVESSKRNDLQLTRTINVFVNNFFFPFLAGSAIFMVIAGLAVAMSRALPAWLGWLGFVLGIVSFTPIGFFFVLGGVIWVLVASIIMIVRPAATAGSPGPGPPPAATTAA
jgi:hypothetical protein